MSEWSEWTISDWIDLLEDAWVDDESLTMTATEAKELADTIKSALQALDKN